MNSSTSSPAELSNDLLIDIFLRLDHSCVFNCILVCKDWLNVITEPAFRQDYLNVHPSPVVGFLVHWCQQHGSKYTEHCDQRHCILVTLLATSKLGRTIMTSPRLQQPGYIISHSDGFLLSGTIPDNLCVHKAFTAAAHDLPIAPASFKKAAVAITAQDSDHFKVILVVVAKTTPSLDTSLAIQTFSSSTWRWEQSNIPCFQGLRLTGEPGLVSSKGVVYWPTSQGLAAYDTAEQDISLIGVQKYHNIVYGVSPTGSICCAVTSIVSTWMIQAYALDETSGEWKFMYEVDLRSVCERHSLKLEGIFHGMPKVPFRFVSFVHGRKHCIYLELKRVIFLYNVDTKELDRISPGFYCNAKDVPSGSYIPSNRNVPLTLADLGLWPVSSPVLHLQ